MLKVLLAAALALALEIGLATAADKAPTAPAPGAAVSATGRPEREHRSAQHEGMPVSGKVLEVLDVEGFTYLRLKTRDGELWAAVSSAPVKAGADVTINDTNLMTNFESRKLNRKFDRIVFGSLAGAAKPSTAGGRPPGHPAPGMAGAPAPTAAPAAEIKVAKATGAAGRTVAEIVAKRTELKDKPVEVRGQVVKFTPGVMGKNWIHLRDGTGSAADGTNDVTVTTKAEAKVGDVVLVKGVVRTDRDLGSGYAYKVLVEDATLAK